MTITANFTLGGTDYTDRGYVATAGGTVALALEDALSTDVKSAVVRLVSLTKNTTGITELDVDDPGFSMDPPSDGMTLTIPNEVGSWTIEVQINGGASARGVEAAWTRTRIISTVGSSGVTKTCPAERDEYDPEAGWTAAQNAMVDALDGVIDGGSTDPDDLGVSSLTTEWRADKGVEHSYRVGIWRDRRTYRDLERIQPPITGGLRPPVFDADFGDGMPALQFPGAMASLISAITSDVFSIAFRVRFPDSDVVLLSCGQCPPGSNPDPDGTSIIVGADYTAGGSTSITASLSDDAVSTPVVASQTATHSAWHTVIVRSTGSTIRVRVDGVNGATANTSGLGPLTLLDTTAIGCVVDGSDGSLTGTFDDGALRHVAIADGVAWSDADCLLIEAGMTDLWT